MILRQSVSPMHNCLVILKTPLVSRIWRAFFLLAKFQPQLAEKDPALFCSAERVWWLFSNLWLLFSPVPQPRSASLRSSRSPPSHARDMHAKLSGRRSAERPEGPETTKSSSDDEKSRCRTLESQSLASFLRSPPSFLPSPYPCCKRARTSLCSTETRRGCRGA